MMFLLLEWLGLKGMGKGALLLVKWAVRLIVLAVFVAAILIAVFWLYNLGWLGATRIAGIAIAVVGMGVVVFRTWRRGRQKSEPEAAERTIDGKVVPDKLAAAALSIPAQSPDGEYVLRGLPDYGKALLKLNLDDFEYLPPLPEKPPELPPVEEPAVKQTWFTVPRLAIAAGIAALVIVAGVGFYQAASGSSHGSANIQSVSEPVVAAQKLPEPATMPAPAGEAKNEPDFAAATKALAGDSPAPVADSVPDNFEASRKAEAELKNTLKEFMDPVGTWRDTTTGLLWPTKDNGPEILDSYQKAKRYCRTLDVGGVTGWRLPNIRELDALEDPKGGFRGGIHSTKYPAFYWSSTTHGATAEGAQMGDIPGGTDVHDFAHALCVHD